MGINDDDDDDDEPDKIPTHHLGFCLLGFCLLGLIPTTTMMRVMMMTSSSVHPFSFLFHQLL